MTVTFLFYLWESQRMRVEVCPELWAINHIVIPWYSFVPNLHMLLASIPNGSKFLMVIDLCSAFFIIPIDEASQSVPFCLHLGGRTIYLDSNASGFYWKHSFLTNSEYLFGWYNFPKRFHLIAILESFTSLLFFLVSSQEDTIHLLDLLSLKQHRVSKES